MSEGKSFLHLICAPLACLASAATAEEVTIASWGGSYQAAQRSALFEPYTKQTGVKILEDEHNGDISKIKAMVQGKSVSWGVANMGMVAVLQGCDQGLLETVDKSVLGDPADYLPGAVTRCGVASDTFANVIAYDASRFTGEHPKTISDFFDLKKWPGKRGMEKSPEATLEFALMGDGVPTAEIYKLLGTKEGLDRAFKSLDRIKSQIVWWEAGAQPPQLLANGEVTMTTAYNGRIYNADHTDNRNFAILWDGQVYDFDVWAIPKGTPQLAEANKFLAFALQPQNMAALTNFIPYGPTRQSAQGKVPTAIQSDLPTAAPNMKNALLLNSEFWAENFDDVNKRFQAWLAQ